MADDGFDGGAAAHLSLNLWGHPSLLLRGVDFELVIGRRVVAAISCIGVEPFDRIADELLDRRNDAGQRMAVIGIARQRLRVDDELAALAVLEGGGDTDLDAELVGLVRLALADALHLGRMQAVDLGPALSALLGAYAPRQAQQMSECCLKPGIAIDLAGNVADHSAEIGLERAQSPLGALELLRMGVTLMLDQGELADPRVGLTELHAQPFWPASPASRAPGSAAWRRWER